MFKSGIWAVAFRADASLQRSAPDLASYISQASIRSVLRSLGVRSLHKGIVTACELCAGNRSLRLGVVRPVGFQAFFAATLMRKKCQKPSLRPHIGISHDAVA